jgi:hypothetical protein
MGMTLERFDSALPAENHETGPSEDYLAGFRDGKAEVHRTVAAANELFHKEVVAALGDLAFGYVEARQHVIEGLAPMLSQISRSIVPTLLQEGFAVELFSYLNAVSEAESGSPIHLRINKRVAAEIGPLLSLAPSLPIHLSVDDTLKNSEAVWASGQSETSLDTDILVAGIRDAIEAVIFENSRKEHHG